MSAEFLLLTDDFPRSVRFCVREINAALRRISGVAEGNFRNDAEKLAGRLLAELSSAPWRKFSTSACTIISTRCSTSSTPSATRCSTLTSSSRSRPWTTTSSGSRKSSNNSVTGMKLHVVHRTRFTYGAPVRESFNEARLQPLSSVRQTCHRFELKVHPSPRMFQYTDFYGNSVHQFEILPFHSELLVEAVSTVTTRDRPFSRLVPPRLHSARPIRLRESNAASITCSPALTWT